jgi:hypothetical protein
MVVGAGNSVGACDSKTARKNTAFSCPEGYGVGDDTGELAVVGDVGG